MYAILIVVVTVALSSTSSGSCLSIVSRQEWGAREPKLRENMTLPVDTVVIHHTYIPGACHSMAQCVRDMRAMQNFHMDTRGWNDFAYSFAIGGDKVFEGRGWYAVGAHAPGYNNHSIGIAFIGDYRNQLPTEAMLSEAKELIQYGIDNNYIQADYQLLGHRQVRDTECPGDALYQLIQSWGHWTPQPSIKIYNCTNNTT